MPMIPGRAALRSRRSCVEGSSTAAQRKELLIEESAGTHRRLVDAGIIGWIILGLLAGAIAKLLLPGDDPGGIIITPITGVAGAFLGGLIAKALGFGDPIDEFFDWSTWIAAIIGSMLLLLAYRLIAGRRDRGLRDRLT